MEQLTISVSAAAKALGLGRTSIYALIKQNRIETIKIGRRTLPIFTLPSPANSHLLQMGAQIVPDQ